MELVINNNLFNVKTVMTRKDIERGMMGKKFNKDFNGMLFLMSDGQHGFWMKDCIIPLDIIFISNNVITKIYHKCPPCNTNECKSYIGEGDTILEVQGNTCKKLGIKIGDKISA